MQLFATSPIRYAEASKEVMMSAIATLKPRRPVAASPRGRSGLSAVERREIEQMNERFDREIVRLQAEADEVLRQIRARSGG